MADRISQYSMVPNFSAGLIQQQQLNQQQAQHHHHQQQQQQQQQQDVHPNLPGFPDQGRMWEQIQHLQQLHPGVGEINNVQSQVADFMRGQSLNQAQGQQQQQQQLGQQQFALQRMANGGNGRPSGATQQPSQSFHDPSIGQAQQQPHISPGFQPINTSGLTGAPSLNARNAALMALQANRQLDLMTLAHNQHQQNGFTARLEQQQRQQQAQHQQLQAMNQSSPADMFSSPGMASSDRRPSPAHPNLQPQNPMGGQPLQQQQQQQRPMTLAELTDRAAALRAHIDSQEQNLQNYSQTDPNQLAKFKNDLKNKKEYLTKLLTVIQKNSGGAGANMSTMAQVAATQPQASGVGQPSWMPQPGTSQSFETSPNVQLARAQMQSQQQQVQNNAQPSPSHHAQTQGNHSLPQPIVPPRSGTTPHQLQHSSGGGASGGQFPNQMSPNMGQFPFTPGNGGGASSPPSMLAGPQQPPVISIQFPPPLEKTRFENAYKSFTTNKGIKHEMRLINVDGRSIDLYALHTCVMQEGGPHKVHNNDLWAVIGGRMGFVHFPGTEAEPAKSAPGIAQRLAQVYKEYLMTFDTFYISSVLESRKKMQLQAAVAAHQAQVQATARSGGVTQPQQPQQQQNRPTFNAQQMQAIVSYANQSVADLRAQGVQERVIQFVEANRAYLQRTVMEQGIFRGQLQGPRDQQNIPNSGGGFAGSPSQSNTLVPPQQHLVSQNQRQFMQQQNGILPMQGNNFMDNRQQHPQTQNPNQFQFSGRPTREQVAVATAFITKAKEQFLTSNTPTRPVDVPTEQRTEFNHMLDQLHRFGKEMDNKLPMYYLLFNAEDVVKKLIAIILTANHQRSLLSSGSPPQFIISLEQLRSMMLQVQKSNDMFTVHLQAALNRPQHQHQQQQVLHPNPPPSDISRPSASQHPIPPQLPNRSPVNLRPPPVTKKASSSTQNPQPSLAQPPPNLTASTPTPPPAYSALTPVANASTPTHAASSPQAPKSPKGKGPVKQKAAPKRRVSIKNAPALTQPEQQSQPPASSGSGNASSSSSGSNTKRQREEEPSATFEASPSSGSVANEPSPPKRIKTEWEGPPNDALRKKKEAVENVKTEEDASAFLEKMTELIKMAAGGEGQESLNSDISDTLDMILKGYGATPDGLDLGISSHTIDESRVQNSSPPSIPAADEFVEFFDFSSFGTLEDDDDSKAPTPDLLSSSSTNPSPESGSEADAAHHALLSSTDIKTEDIPDLLRLGNWKEIDGGESAYYQASDWKWDSPMPTHSWAIS